MEVGYMVDINGILKYYLFFEWVWDMLERNISDRIWNMYMGNKNKLGGNRLSKRS